MAYASFGSVSSGTMRREDLLETFASELEYQIQRNAEEWCSDEGRARRDSLLDLVHGAYELSGLLEEEGSETESDPDEVIQELADALNEFAPPYGYFGSHPGDGADYGYWLSDSLECDFDGLKVSDTSEVPDDYSGEVLHVNDHGNVTLYAANAGELVEVWAVV